MHDDTAQSAIISFHHNISLYRNSIIYALAPVFSTVYAVLQSASQTGPPPGFASEGPNGNPPVDPGKTCRPQGIALCVPPNSPCMHKPPGAMIHRQQLQHSIGVCRQGRESLGLLLGDREAEGSASDGKLRVQSVPNAAPDAAAI